MSNDIELRIRRLIADSTEMDLEKVTLNATPDELGIDSMKMVDVLFALEEEFDITIPFNANDQNSSEFSMSKVGDVIDWVEKLTGNSA